MSPIKKILRNKDAKKNIASMCLVMMIILSSFTVLFLFPNNDNTVSAADAWYATAGWGYRMKITIDHTKVYGTNTNFPVLINVTSASFTGIKVQADGDDFLFTTQAGTKIAHEIERFNYTAGCLNAWVNVSSVTSGADVILYIYYGNAGASNQQNVPGVWDTNRYVAVYHSNDLTTSSINDSRDIKDGAKRSANNPAQIAGMIGYGQNYSGTGATSSIVVETAAANLTSRNFGLNPITLSAWFKADTAKTQCIYTTLHYFGAPASSDRETAIYWIGGKIYGQFRNATPVLGGASNVYSGAVSAGTWYFVTSVRQADYKVVGYINGAYFSGAGSLNNRSGANANYKDSREERIGCDGAEGSGFDGIIDEVRLQRANTTFDWHRTEYNNQNSPTTFITVGGEELGVTASSYELRDLSYGSRVTFQGKQGQTVWCNDTGYRDETVEIYMVINATTNITEIRVKCFDLNDSLAHTIGAGNLSIQFSSDNVTWGAPGNVRTFVNGGSNISINETNWLVANGCYGANPFDGAGLNDTTASIYFHIRLHLDTTETATFYTSTGTVCKVYLGRYI